MIKHKLHEKELQESNERFRELVELLPETVFEINAEGNLTFANHVAFDTFGYSQEDFTEGLNVLQMLIPEDRDRAKENIQRVLSGERLGSHEYTGLRKDGSTFPVIIHTGPITRKNKPMGLRGIVIDFTERKRAEETLQQSEEKSRRMLESVTEGITVTDLNGVITEANEKTAQMHGFSSKDELLGRSAFKLIAPHDHEKAVENMHKTLEKGSVRGIEYSLLKADGSEFPGELSASMLKDAYGNPIGFIAITRDISEQKRFRENMQFYIAEITRAQEEERKRIARELHDDTAQSLATLALEIDALSNSKEHLSKEATQRLEQLRADTLSILEEVRRFSHELRPDVLDQLGLIPALELLTDELNSEGKVSARVELLGPERRLSSEAELVLFRIAQEALRNVRRHSKAIEAVVRLEFTSKKVKLNVTDNGRGFELPEALSDFASRGKLGLIGMRERVRLLDGSFLLKSQTGKGTAVAVVVEQ